MNALDEHATLSEVSCMTEALRTAGQVICPPGQLTAAPVTPAPLAEAPDPHFHHIYLHSFLM